MVYHVPDILGLVDIQHVILNDVRKCLYAYWQSLKFICSHYSVVFESEVRHRVVGFRFANITTISVVCNFSVIKICFFQAELVSDAVHLYTLTRMSSISARLGITGRYYLREAIDIASLNI